MPRSFSSPGLILAALAGLLLLAGCGGTKHTTTSTASTNPTAPLPATSTTSSAQATTTAPASTTKSSTTPTPKTTSTSNPTGGAGLPSGSSAGGASSGGGSTNARVPATFTIASGGQLSPSTVSAPAFLAVQVTVVSHDGRAHQVLLRTPTPHSLAVPAYGRASVLLPGLRAGRYPLAIDGAPRGALSIGGEPGP